MNRRKFLMTGAAGAVSPFLFPETSMAREVAGNHEPNLELSWLGGATLVIRFDGRTLLTDPAFGEGRQAFLMGDPNEMFDLAKGPNIKHHARISPFPGIEIGNIDHMLLSHLHEDHFDQVAQARLPKSLPALVPADDAKSLRAKGFSGGKVLDWGQSTSLKTAGGAITITAIPADHSPDPEIAKMLGRGNGYWFEFQKRDWRKTLYWSGDTFPTARVLTALRTHGSPDIFAPHLGAVGITGPLGQISMGAEQAIQMASQVQARIILPLHHSTYELYLEPIWKLARLCEGQPFRLDLLSEGTRVIYA